MGKISNTSKYATVTPTSSDYMVATDVSDSNNTKTVTIASMATPMLGSVADATPVIDDKIIGLDTSDSNTAKKFSLSDIPSLFLEHIEYFDVSSSAATDLSTPATGTWVVMNTTTTSTFSNGNLTHANNKTTYTGSTPKTFKLEATCSGTAATDNQIHFAFFKNDVLVASSEQMVKLDSAAVYATTPIQCLVSLSNNDYIRVYVKNTTAQVNFQLSRLNVIVSSV